MPKMLKIPETRRNILRLWAYVTGQLPKRSRDRQGNETAVGTSCTTLAFMS